MRILRDTLSDLHAQSAKDLERITAANTADFARRLAASQYLKDTQFDFEDAKAKLAMLDQLVAPPPRL